MRPAAFEPFAGLLAILAGLAGFIYSVAFVILSRSAPDTAAAIAAVCLLLAGLLSSAPLVAVYLRLHQIEAGFAFWAMLLGGIAALGSALHGGFDLANAINPPAGLPGGAASLPSAVDPRGLLTFGVAGIAQITVGWLMTRGSPFPIGLAYLGVLSGILLVVIYLGRLIVLQPTSPLILVPAVIEGFVISPAWYVWLGVVMLAGRARGI
jgi:hypothetical protein